MDAFPFALVTAVACATVFLISILLTGLTRQLAIRKNILDIPNERSSHHIPTPRGGGIAIVVMFTLSLLMLGMAGWIASNLLWALVGGGFLIALLGYADDVYSVPTRIRIILHFLAAIWAVHCLGGFSHLDFGTWTITLHTKGSLLAIIGIVWCINLYNFMDGIDGLAGSEGLFVAVASGMALCFSQDYHSAFILWLLAAAIAGFVVWNWPPAKIFLGDVGSGFLGYQFAVLGVYTANQGTLPINCWLILLAVFLCDATFTVIHRMMQGKRWYTAHKEHAYQHLLSCGASHKQITLSITLINLVLLLPLVLAAFFWPLRSFWLMAGSVMLLWILWFCIKSLNRAS